MNFKHRTACKCHLNINDLVTIKYKTIYDFILISVEKEQIFNVFKESAEKVFDLNRLVSATHNDKNLISLLDKLYKASVMKWKIKNTLVNKLTKQMKVLTLTLKIILTVLVSASSYFSVAVPQPAIAYILQTNFSASAAAVMAVRNLRSAAVALDPNQCAFYWLEGY